MAEMDLEGLIGPALAGAIAKKGYTTLTPVQEAVLDPALEGRDLRISSQTGSGKTVAIGFTLRAVVEGDTASSPKGAARPRALVVTPTRELAKQVETELSWLFAPLRTKVACVTGGGDFRDERRSLGSGPAIVVGTPGRLLDHLKRGAVDGSQLGAVVLDEADRMLDLGFREDLEAILAFAPEGHRTHLVSATFPREVTALANRVQTDPARIEGTPLGTANTDIEHLVHVVLPNERLDAIVNLLLETPDATTLIFARTRADVGELTHLLADAGFTVDSLSGEMEQRERNKALASFKRGDLHALVATDVAARGIDVQDIARVLHAEPPSDADAYTHRSGRTGRAGRQGKSSVLVTPPAVNRVSALLNRAKVRWRFDPVPTAQSIEATREQRLFEDLTSVAPPEDPSEAASRSGGSAPEADERSWALAKRITDAGEATQALARMIARTRRGGPEARRISVITPPQLKKRPWEDRAEQGPRRGNDRNDRNEERPYAPGDFARAAPRENAEREGRAFGESRGYGEARGLRPDRATQENGPTRTPRDPETDAGAWTNFRVSWGQIHGADARRLLAMVCRRGGIRGSDVGAIRVARTFSTIAVAGAVATAFERATREPDPRDPKVRIRLEGDAHADHERDEGEREPSLAARPKSVREVAPPERKSTRSVREVAPPERKSVQSVRDIAQPERKSSKSVREVAPPERKSAISVRDVATERKSTKSVREVEPERPARARTLVVDLPSKTRDADKPAKPARDEELATPAKPAVRDTERPTAADRTAPRSAHGDRSSRPRSSQPERYSRRPQPRPAGPERGADRGAHERDRGPRPSHGGPPYGGPPRDRERGPRPGQGSQGPHGPPDRDRRPPQGGPPDRDHRPPQGGPPSRDRGPGPGGPRPPHAGPRPTHPGARPNGPPSRHGGDAPLKRKKRP